MASNEKNTTETQEVIGDLIEVNNDRIKIYRQALVDLSSAESELNQLFNELIAQSQRFEQAFTTLFDDDTSQLNEGPPLSGKIYRAWADVYGAFNDRSSQFLLTHCEKGEQSMQQIYRTALKEPLTEVAHSLLSDQLSELERTYKKIWKLRGN